MVDGIANKKPNFSHDKNPINHKKNDNSEESSKLKIHSSLNYDRSIQATSKQGKLRRNVCTKPP